MGSLFLVRHATTGASAAGRNLGQADDPGLTAEGERLAARTGAAIRLELAGVAPSPEAFRVVSSPALRCLQTAAAIVAALAELGLEAQTPIEEEPSLRELDYGAWEGLTPEECRARNPVERAAWEGDPYLTRAPGGESGRDVARRAFPVLEALEAWVQVAASRTAVAVSHNHVLRLRLVALLGLPLRDYRRRLVTDPGAYSFITFGDRQPAMRRLNAVPR
jgi:broad specificity phosphatase PhoE